MNKEEPNKYWMGTKYQTLIQSNAVNDAALSGREGWKLVMVKIEDLQPPVPVKYPDNHERTHGNDI